MTPLLSIDNLKVSLKDPRGDRIGWVLRGLRLAIKEGEKLALVGESGCGKSMTALSILNLLPRPPMEMVEGRVQFKGKDLSLLTEEGWRQTRGKEIAIIFQEPFTSLNPVLRVDNQIAEVLRTHSKISERLILEKVHSLLVEVGLPDPDRVARQYPHQLSGGMCQRVMIAMAIACGPSLLIADEPTTALDVTVQAQILDLLYRMTESHKMAVLLITHDLRIAHTHSDRVAILYAGQVVEEATPVRMFDHPQHPYTEGLLEALPEFSHKGRPLYSIRGSVRSPFETAGGCAFAGRCPKATEKCRVEDPPLGEIEKGHWVRCFYPSGK